MTSGRTHDIVEIQQLCARYAHFLDQGRADDAAELFTDDGVWDGSASGIGVRAGREEIRQGFARGGHTYLHLSTSHLVELADDDHDRAVGCEYLIATTTSAQGEVHLAISRLEDRYERGAHGWRFAARRLTPLQSSRWSPDQTRFASPTDLPPPF